MGIGHGLALCYVTYVTHVYIYVPAPGRLLPGFIDITCILNDKKISSKISHFFAFRLLTRRWKCSLYSQNFVLICYAKKVKFSRKKNAKKAWFLRIIFAKYRENSFREILHSFRNFHFREKMRNLAKRLRNANFFRERFRSL